MPSALTFNGTDLTQLTGIEVNDYEFNNYPNRQLRSYKLANQHRSGLTSAEYVDKTVTVNAVIRDCDRESSEATLMLLKANVQAIKGSLTTEQAERTITYTATLQSMSHKWVANNLMVVLVFYLAEPLGVDSATETLIAAPDQNTTNATDDFAITLQGSSLEQYPTITVDVNSLTIGAGGTITVGNSDNDFEVAVTAVFEAGDTLLINTFDKLVLLNGAEVDYEGRIPEFYLGTTDITYEDDFSARDVDVSAVYARRYV